MKQKLNRFLSTLISLCMVMSMLPGVSLTASAVTADEDGFITFSSEQTFSLSCAKPSWDGTLEYSADLSSWTEWDGSEIASSADGKLYLRGSGNNYITGSAYNWEKLPFVLDGTDISCSGNIMTLLSYTNPPTKLSSTYTFAHLFRNNTELISAPDFPSGACSQGCYYFMFAGCTKLTTPPSLNSTTLANECYYGMFQGCTALKTAPALNASPMYKSCYKSMFENCTNLETAPVLNSKSMNTACYSYMFSGCTALKSAPDLPATELATECYSYMFNGCTALETAPALNATTMKGRCYQGMFYGCTSLKKTPDLPATKLADYCYNFMFSRCSSLTDAPKLEATTLTDSCYDNMFSKCSSLYSAPELNATTLAKDCYYYMFNGCTALKTAPALPATELANRCYYGMFSGCTAMEAAPALNATTLADSCYDNMFRDCTALKTVPELKVTDLKKDCYHYMFGGCTSLKTVPELNATTLAEGCYDSMFKGCTALETLPELNATTLAEDCYTNMFYECKGIKLSETMNDLYRISWSIPSTADTTGLTSWNSAMFESTGGSFKGAPTAGVTYYLYDPNSHTHSWSTDWSSDSTAHWHECTADNCTITENSEKDDYTTHSAPADDGNCETAVKCSVCQYVFTAAKEHSFGTKNSGVKASDATCIANQKNYVQCDNCQVNSTDKTVDVTNTKLSHNYTYSLSQNKKTITESCDRGCGHSASVTISAPTGTLVYNGSSHNAKISYSGTLTGGNDLSVSYTKNGNPSTDTKGAGEYAASITLGGETASLSYTVAKATVTLPTVSSKTYNGETQKADISDTATYKVTKNDGGVNYGEYDVILELTDFDNYEWSGVATKSATLRFKITSDTNEWTANPVITGWTYGETASSPTGRAKYGTVVFTYYDGNKSALTSQPINAGRYYMTASVDADGNNYAEIKTDYIQFEISKADKTSPIGIGKADTSFIDTLDGKITGVNTEMEYKLSTASAYTAVSGTEITGLSAGTYYVRYKETDNYNASAPVTITINKGGKRSAEIAILSDLSKTYNNIAVSVSASDYSYNGDGVTTVKWYADSNGSKGAEITAPINAGTYWVGISAAEGDVYNKADEVTRKFTIAKADYDMSGITFADGDFTYDGTAHSLVISGTLPTGADGKQVTVAYSGSATNVSDGVQTVTATFATASTNYNLPAAMTAEVKINAKDISNAVITLANSLTYNGNEQTQNIEELKIDGLTVTYDISGNSATNVKTDGDYTLTVTGNGNFKGQKTAAWNIAKANAVISVDTTPIAQTYGDNWTLPVAATNFGTVQVDKAVSDMVNAGAYTVTYTVTGTDNYNGDQKMISVTINQKAAENVATPSAENLTYGQTLADSALTGGWVWADSTELPPVTNSGYTAYYAIADDSNYDWTAINGYDAVNHRLARTVAVTVSKQQVTIPAEDTTLFTYNGSEQTYSILADSRYTVANDKRTNAGSQNVAVTLNDTANYEWEDQTTEEKTYIFSIAKATPTAKTKPTASDAKLGNKLETSTLSSNGAVLGVDGLTLDGTFAWKDGSEQLLSNGNTLKTVLFTPTDTENYNTLEFDVNVFVYSSFSNGVSGYKVTFNSNGGSQVDAATVTRNSCVTKPVNPTKDGFTFNGWYTDAELSEKYDFESKVTKSFTLYADWLENEPEDNDTEGTSGYNPFIDVTEDDWFYDDIMEAYSTGLIKGTSNNIFSPSGDITRGMFIAILWRAEGEPEEAQKSTFEDVEHCSYYEKAIDWGAKNAIILGFSNTKYAPDKAITREQMSAILYRYAKYKGYDVSVGEDTNILSYKDFGKISAYAIEAMQWACGEGVIGGKGNGILDPLGNATRSEATAMLVRLLGRIE